MKSQITVSACYNVKSGYNTILKTVLEQTKSFSIRPRSYSMVSSEFVKYFEHIKYEKELCDLCIMPPCNLIDITHPIFHIIPHKNRILFTMWESTRTSDIFIDQLNKMKCVIVPNKWNCINFQNQGCIVPIHIVPLFADVELFNYTQPSNNDCFVFGVANNDPRKRMYDVIKCFINAFPNEKNVKLKIKSTTPLDFRFTDSRIDISESFFTQYELKNWYGSIDVFVSGVSAEGWGLMQHESMLCGRPVVATKYAGLSEFINETNSYCLNYTEEKSSGYWETAGGKWSKYDDNHLIETLRYCYNNRSDVVSKGLTAHNDMSKYTEDVFIKNIETIIINSL